jgi:hypothetical protein
MQGGQPFPMQGGQPFPVQGGQPSPIQGGHQWSSFPPSLTHPYHHQVGTSYFFFIFSSSLKNRVVSIGDFSSGDFIQDEFQSLIFVLDLSSKIAMLIQNS